MQKKRLSLLLKSSRNSTKPPFICSKTFPVMFPPPTSAARRTGVSLSMGLFPRASRNTFLSRAYTGISNEIRILAPGCPPRRYYDLERLWRMAPKLELPDQPDGPSSGRDMHDSAFGQEHFSGESFSSRPRSGRSQQ